VKLGISEGPQEEKVKLEKGHCHTQKWVLANYGVDPLKLPIPFREVENPHYSSAPPMKLWNEEDVSPYRDQKGVDRHRVRSEAGKKGAETRKKNLRGWFEQIKSDNPRVKEITKRLWEIGNEISDLQARKEKCRKSNNVDDGRDYFEYSDADCGNCAK
jgi:hypothetical protein